MAILKEDKEIGRELDALLKEQKASSGVKAALSEQLFEWRARERRWAPFLEGLKDPWMRYTVATCLENTLREMRKRRAGYSAFREDVLSAHVGSFDKFIFPIIRALFPNLAATELVTVQPMTAPVGLIFFLDYLYGKSKGNVTAGTRLWQPGASETYASETVQGEVVTASGVSANAAITGTLAFKPVKPGSVTFTAPTATGSVTVTDDGAGNLIGDVGTGGTRTITYSTGAFSFSFNAATTGATTATYDFNAEFSAEYGQIDIVLNKAPVTAEERRLKGRWSVEAQQDLEALHGISAGDEIANAITAELGFEVDLQIIAELDAAAFDGVASGDIPQWNINPPVGVAWADHLRSLKQVFLKVDSLIHRRSGRAALSWIVGGYSVVDVIRDQEGFKQDPGYTHEGRGVLKVGVWNGWDVYRNPEFANTKWLAGFKPSSFVNAGYVFAPYQPLYTTPVVALEDFGIRQGFATRYGTRLVHPTFYVKGTIGT
jgi:hypothetical protein